MGGRNRNKIKIFFVFTSKNVATNQSQDFFFLSSSKFEVWVHVVKINAARDQNQLLNPALKLESLPTPELSY